MLPCTPLVCGRRSTLAAPPGKTTLVPAGISPPAGTLAALASVTVPVAKLASDAPAGQTVPAASSTGNGSTAPAATVTFASSVPAGSTAPWANNTSPRLSRMAEVATQPPAGMR